MRQVSVEADRWGTRLRVIDGFVDGRPWPTLSAVLYMGGAGSGRELVTVAVEPRIENRDVSYRLGDRVASIAFQRLAEKGLVEVDCSTGLALIQTGANRAWTAIRSPRRPRTKAASVSSFPRWDLPAHPRAPPPLELGGRSLALQVLSSVVGNLRGWIDARKATYLVGW